MLNDLFFAFRMLRKNPVFTAAAVLTLTLGIGANTAVFSVAFHVLGSLPYPEPDRLVRIRSASLEKDFEVDPSLPDFLDMREAAAGFERMEAFRYQRAPLDGDEEQMVLIAKGTPGFLDLVAPRASKGRLFSKDDLDAGEGRAAVLSFEFWVSRYGGSDEALGETLRLGDDPYTIIGVAQPITGPLLSRADVFIPWDAEGSRSTASRGARGGLRSLARLREGVTMAQAQAELDTIGEALRREYPEESGEWAPKVVSVYEETVEGFKPTLLALTGASVLILLIAVANLANLMLARGSRRRAELAIRSALGAGRARLIRLLLGESLLLSLLGGAAALALAWGLVEAFLANTPISIPRMSEVRVDFQVIAACFAVSVASGLAFGLAPVLSLGKVSQAAALNEGGRPPESRSIWGQSGLVVAQLSLSLILLAGAGLMIRSFLALQAAPLGIDYRQIVALSIGPTSYGNFSDREQRLQLYGRILESIRTIPGVEDATLTSQAPLSGGWGSLDIEVLSGPKQGSEISPELVGVSGDFFRFFGSRALEGRLFGPQDVEHADSLVVVDANLAERVWPEVPAAGQRLSFRGNEAEVIGVVEPIRYGDLAEEMRPKLYNLLQHSTGALGGTILIRHAGEPEPIMASARSRVEEIDPTLRIGTLQPLEAFYDRWLRRPRFFLFLLGGLGALALTVAAVGVYGVMSYSVSRRTTEVGIRMALGATRMSIFGLFYRRTAIQLAIGLTCGALGALWLTRYLESLLYEVQPGDPAAMAATAIILSLTAALAILLPVRRAAGVNPAQALRE